MAYAAGDVQHVADSIAVGEGVDPDDDAVLAVISVTEKYRIDKAHECQSVFKTTDTITRVCEW